MTILYHCYAYFKNEILGFAETQNNIVTRHQTHRDSLILRRKFDPTAGTFPAPEYSVAEQKVSISKGSSVAERFTTWFYRKH